MATLAQITELINKQSAELKQQIISSNADLSAKIDNLIADVRSEIDDLKNENQLLRDRMDRLEDTFDRNARSAQLVIRNIPLLKSENLVNIFNDIASTIGFKVNYQPHLYRLMRPNTTAQATNQRMTRKGSMSQRTISSPPIMAIFIAKEVRNEFLRLYFIHKNLNLTDIGIETDAPIFISENLPTSNYNLFCMAVDKKKSGLVTKIKVLNGLVHVSTDPASSTSFSYRMVANAKELDVVVQRK